MWKNSLKNVESDNNKIFYETLLDLFLQRNGTYFLNKPLILLIENVVVPNVIVYWSLKYIDELWPSSETDFFHADRQT